MNSKRKAWIIIWWLLQLCGLIFVTRHLGHFLVDMLLLFSIAGIMLGGRKISIIASFGFAAYAALTLFFALLLCSFEDGWLTPKMVLIVAILNLVISYLMIKNVLYKE